MNKFDFMRMLSEPSPMPSESVLLAQIALNILTATEEISADSTSLPFLKETARKLLQDVSSRLADVPLVGGSPPSECCVERPTTAAQPDASAESVASHTRRDFTRWSKSLGLPAGHVFYTVGGGQSKVCFKLVWGRDGKALLETTCPDGVILRGLSPTGILKAYIKKTTGKEANVDGWKRLSIRSPNGLMQWQIRDEQWTKYKWHDGKFVCLED